MKKSSRFLFVLLLALILSVGAYAFAASNTVPQTIAGDGQGTISGLAVSSIHYNLNADPSKIDSVTFSVDKDLTGVQVQIQLAPAGSWYSCIETGTSVTCTTTDATVLSATSLRVIAAN